MQTIDVTFDGKVFRPFGEAPNGIAPNTRMRITYAPITEKPQSDDAWSILESMIGATEMEPDWALNHDIYAARSSTETEFNPNSAV